MPRKTDANWIGFQASDEEKKLLEKYCYDTRQTKTEVLRQLLRDLQPASFPYSIYTPISQEENEILEAYCYDTRQTKTDVLRSFIRGLGQKEEETYSESDHEKWLESQRKLQQITDNQTLITSKEQIRPWLQSITDEAVQGIEDEDAKSLRSMAQQLLSIAERLES